MVEISPTVVFFAILFSVPLQFYFSPRSTSDLRFYFHKFLEDAQFYLNRWLPARGPSSHGTESENELERLDENYENDEELITELLEGKGAGKRGDAQQQQQSGRIDETKAGREFFGGSDEPRDPRPPHVRYRVGQVIRHKVNNYRGVIFAWDEKAKAPEWWLKKAHKGHQEWAEEPNYTVLIDTRDRLIPQIGYIVQDNIELDEGAVIHPLIKHYFESFDGTCYKSRPWHKSIYPND